MDNNITVMDVLEMFDGTIVDEREVPGFPDMNQYLDLNMKNIMKQQESHSKRPEVLESLPIAS